MRYLTIFVAGLGLQLFSVPTAGATTISYYFESPPLLEYVAIYAGEDGPDNYDASQDKFYLEAALRDYAHYISGLQASFTIDWNFFGDDRANQSGWTRDARGTGTCSVGPYPYDDLTYWCNPAPEWLVDYNPPGGEGLVIDEFSFGTDANGDLAWFTMVSWDIPPFFEIWWLSPTMQNSPGDSYFATWVSGPCPSPCSYEEENGAEVFFYATGGTVTTKVWPTAPTPVPLPAGAWLLLSALVGLTGLRSVRPALHALHRRRVAA